MQDQLAKFRKAIEAAIRKTAVEKRRRLRGPDGRIRTAAIEDACAILERDGHTLTAAALCNHSVSLARSGSQEEGVNRPSWLPPIWWWYFRWVLMPYSILLIAYLLVCAALQLGDLPMASTAHETMHPKEP